MKETFRYSAFGVKLESCINIGSKIVIPSFASDLPRDNTGIYRTMSQEEKNVVKFLNNIIKNNTTAALIDKNNNEIDNHFFFFEEGERRHFTESGNKWTLQFGWPILCDSNLPITKREIITPILYMGKGSINTYASKNPILSKNKIYEYVEKNLFQSDTFFEGLMILMYYHEVLFNDHRANIRDYNYS